MEQDQQTEEWKVYAFRCNKLHLVVSILLLLLFSVPFVFQDYSKIEFSTGFLIYCCGFSIPIILDLWWVLWLAKLKIVFKKGGFNVYSLYGLKQYVWDDVEKIYIDFVEQANYIPGIISLTYVSMRLIDSKGKKICSTKSFNKMNVVYGLMLGGVDSVLKKKMQKKIDNNEILDLDTVTIEKNEGIKKKGAFSGKAFPMHELSNYKLQGKNILIWGPEKKPMKIIFVKTANPMQFCSIVSEIIRKNGKGEDIKKSAEPATEAKMADKPFSETPKKTGSPLFFRSIIALLFFVGFYVFSILIALGLFYLAYIDIKFGKFNIRLLFFCLVGAGGILYSIFPRFKRFVKPGILLNEKENPKLFAEIRKVSSDTKQRMPSEVYLILDYNAFVSSRGGILGIGSRRIMGVGLPLFHTLSVSGLKSVVAHEFGHYYGGDVALGPMIYNTRETILRTYLTMQKAEHITTFLFRWYAKIFLKITAGISRQQEYSADKLSAEVIGSRTASEQLQKIEEFTFAFSTYNENDFFPVLSQGYSVPYMEGFKMFFKTEEAKKDVKNRLELYMQNTAKSEFDSHPLTKDRVAYVKQLNCPARENNDSAAVNLMGKPEASEKELMAWICKNNNIKQNIEWKDVFDKVWLKIWRERTGGSVYKYGEEIMKKTPAELLKLKDDKSFYPLILSNDQDEADYNNYLRNNEIVNLIGTLIVLTMYKKGWNVTCNPGEPVLAQKDGKTFSPFIMVSEIIYNNKGADEFLQMCSVAGIERIDCK